MFLIVLTYHIDLFGHVRIHAVPAKHSNTMTSKQQHINNSSKCYSVDY